MRLPLLLSLTALLAFGCTTETTRTVKSDAGSTTGADNTDGGDGNDGTNGGTDSTDGGGTDGTTGGGTDGTDGGGTDGTDSADGSEGTDGGPAPAKCGTINEDGLGIGAPCTSHSDCYTGYCYDEFLWNEDGVILNRFCTVGCTGCTLKGNCNEWPKAAGASSSHDNKCLPLSSSFVNYYAKQGQPLTFDSLCLVSCGSDADCAHLPGFSVCALPTFGKDYNYGVNKVCQPAEFAKVPESEF